MTRWQYTLISYSFTLLTKRITRQTVATMGLHAHVLDTLTSLISGQERTDPFLTYILTSAESGN